MKYVIILIICAALIGSVWSIFLRGISPSTKPSNETAATSFSECAEQGNPVMESYPRQCTDSQGNHFVEDVTADWQSSYTNASKDVIVVDNITAGDEIASPVTITGQARGYWFFEASFPVIIVDWDGRIIAEGYAEATDDWMIEDFVPFTATIEFTKPEGTGLINRGTIILQRDNPSDLPENDAAFEIPVIFK